MKLQDLRPKHIVESWLRPNDGGRSLLESTLIPEVERALKDWIKADVKNCVLIGGLAVSYHGLARATVDGDFLFLSSDDVPHDVPGFKKTRPHAFMHKDTHVEIEVLDPDFLGIPKDLVQRIFDTGSTSNGIKIASKAGLIVSKLGRFNRRDQADIEHLLSTGKIDLSDWPLPEGYLDKFNSIAVG